MTNPNNPTTAPTTNPVEQPDFDKWLHQLTTMHSGAELAEKIREAATGCAQTSQTTTDQHLRRYATATSTLLEHIAATAVGHTSQPVRIDAWSRLADGFELSYEMVPESLSIQLHTGRVGDESVYLNLNPSATLNRVITLLQDARTAYDTVLRESAAQDLEFYPPLAHGKTVSCDAWATFTEDTPLSFDIHDGIVYLDIGPNDDPHVTSIRLELLEPDQLLNQLLNALTHIQTEHRTTQSNDGKRLIIRNNIALTSSPAPSPPP